MLVVVTQDARLIAFESCMAVDGRRSDGTSGSVEANVWTDVSLGQHAGFVDAIAFRAWSFW